MSWGAASCLFIGMVSMSSFKKKIIRVTITLDQNKSGRFNEQGNVIIMQGLRVSCNINYGNGQPMPTANIRIWGMKKDDMNKLTSVQWNVQGYQNNIVKIEAGDDPEDLDITYQGNISFCYPDYSGVPDVCLCVESHMSLYWKLNPAPPASYKGEVDVKTVMEDLAKQMNLVFESYGITEKVNNPYLASTAFEQAQSLARQAKIELYMDFERMVICKGGEPRPNKTAIITPSTGMIQYPIITNIGARLTCLYDKNIRAGFSVMVKDSVVEQVNNKVYRVTGLDITLESEMPGGRWNMDITAADIGQPGDVPQVTK
jgi:hypothetical protein